MTIAEILHRRKAPKSPFAKSPQAAKAPRQGHRAPRNPMGKAPKDPFAIKRKR